MTSPADNTCTHSNSTFNRTVIDVHRFIFDFFRRQLDLLRNTKRFSSSQFSWISTLGFFSAQSSDNLSRVENFHDLMAGSRLLSNNSRNLRQFINSICLVVIYFLSHINLTFCFTVFKTTTTFYS